MADDNGVLVPVVEPPAGMAKLNITFNGLQGDLPDPVPYDATDADLKQIATEAVRDGYVPGIDASPDASFVDFVVDRYPARDDIQFNRLSLRPKTPFGDIRTDEEIQDVISKASRGQGTKWPSMTYEEGVEQALLWVTEEIDDNPMEE